MDEIKVQREGVGGARFYIEVADDEGGRFRPDPDNPGMFFVQEIAERAAESALRRFPVARVLEERLTVRRREHVGSITEVAIFDPRLIDAMSAELKTPGDVVMEKPQIQVGNIELDKRLDRGKTIAVIYRRATYGEPDYRRLAQEQVMTAARDASWPIVQMKSSSVELDFHCRVILIDEVAQDDQSRGCRFDRVYVLPPAEMIGDGIRRALVPR